MPFDAGVMAAVVNQLRETAVGARIDKIYQPERDEIILNIRGVSVSRKLLLSACPGNARVGYCKADRENPQTPPMFCMLLRKHLSGGHITDVRQIGFDRAVEIKISSNDEMGFASDKYLICEIMGTYSNIVFLDENRRIVSVLHPVSLSVSNKRQVLCGFEYENPPVQEGKTDALSITPDEFYTKVKSDIESGRTGAADKYLISSFAGLSPLTAREIVYRASGNTSTPLSEIDVDKLRFNYFQIYGKVSENEFCPCLVRDAKGDVVDFSFCEIRQYGANFACVPFENVSEMLDAFFEKRDKQESVKHRGQDILKLLTNAETRISKKIALQRESLAECAGKDGFKKTGELITANMYLLKKGMEEAELVDYSDENMPTVKVKLDIRLTPAQNAQRYFKKYNKAKSAEVMLTEQIAQGEKELSYIDTVFDSLTKAETEADLTQIRNELSMTGYGKKLENMRKSLNKSKKDYKATMKTVYKPMRFKTSGGYEVLCGKNNLQNDYITTVVASKDDYWFHVKNAPGSHVVMRCGKDEPDALDFTQCAMIAVLYSSQKDLPQAPVDYTRVRNVKKPSGSKPGFVIYESNFTAYVTANSAETEALRISEKGE